MSTHVAGSDYGIIVYSNKRKIVLDPKKEISCDFTFVSHAHLDHLCKKYPTYNFKTTNLMSKVTFFIACSRGFVINESNEEHDGFKLFDAGHILGSRGLLIDDEIYYTGDLCIKERAFMKPAYIPKTNTLIIESTFGRPQYKFPSLTAIVHRTNKIISALYDQGIPVILMGYPLGKSQLLTQLFSHWDPIYAYDSVHKMNTIYRKLGILIKETIPYSTAENHGLLAKSKPWIMISPIMHGRNKFVRYLKEKYGAITIGFSGWAVDDRYKFLMGLDYSMPMSDHCDYFDLIEFVKSCNANKIYTFHGFAADFADSLRKHGFDAEPIQYTNLKRRNNKKENKKVFHSSLDPYL